MLKLVVSRGGLRVRTAVFGGSTPIRIGRAEPPDPGEAGLAEADELQLDDPSVAGMLVGITRQRPDDVWLLYGLEDSAPATVNGELVETMRALHHGDEIRLGDTTLRVAIGPDAAGVDPEELARMWRDMLEQAADNLMADQLGELLRARKVTREQVVGMLERGEGEMERLPEDEADQWMRTEVARLLGLPELAALTFEELAQLEPEAIAARVGWTRDQLAAHFGVLPRRDVEVVDAVGLRALRDVVAIQGNLILGPGHIDNLDALAALTRVKGTLALRHVTGLARLELPALREVGNLLIGWCPDLTAIDLAGLERAGTIAIRDNRRLADVALSGITQAGERLDIFACPAVERVACPRLTAIEGKLQLGKSGVTQLHLPALREIGGGLQLGQVDQLERLTLPALERVGGAVALRGLADLQEIETPRLTQVGDGLTLDECPRLARLAASELRLISGQLGVARADGLESLSLETLEAVGGRVTIGMLRMFTVFFSAAAGAGRRQHHARGPAGPRRALATGRAIPDAACLAGSAETAGRGHDSAASPAGTSGFQRRDRRRMNPTHVGRSHKLPRAHALLR